jgi:hypothetical protein
VFNFKHALLGLRNVLRVLPPIRVLLRLLLLPNRGALPIEEDALPIKDDLLLLGLPIKDDLLLLGLLLGLILVLLLITLSIGHRIKESKLDLVSDYVRLGLNLVWQ